MTLLERLKRNWKRAPKRIRQTIVFIIGSTVILTGIAMLVLPGPGWAAIFLGFAILATEFNRAEKARDWMIKQLKIIISYFEKYWNNLKKKLRIPRKGRNKNPKN